MEYIAIMSDGTKIVYDAIDYGHTVLFIHGWAATRAFWHPVRNLPGFRKIIPDLRGHGDSDKSKDYSLERILMDLSELLRGLGVTELSIVGHSLGGVIAAKFASQASEFKVRDLILVATPPEIKFSKLKLLNTAFLLRFLTPVARRTITPRTLYQPRKDLLEFIWRESAKGSIKAYIEFLKTFNGVSIVEDLKAIKARKVAIIPKYDLAVPFEYQKSAYSELCDEIIVIDEAGHNLMLEKPEEFAQILNKILSKEKIG
ncbi:MAG: alpha/beta hydrolase [Crenarchaeota archaeon]|nr:alpha/beta hydrolase [Thermoproteota archaeon]MCR8501899.1 alpha/beta hydrolase [Thermoproteota archaeon]